MRFPYLKCVSAAVLHILKVRYHDIHNVVKVVYDFLFIDAISFVVLLTHSRVRKCQIQVGLAEDVIT